MHYHESLLNQRNRRTLHYSESEPGFRSQIYWCIVQSVEDSSVADFVSIIKYVKPGVVIWSAGAGAGGAGAARLKAVDTDGQIKIMDAVAQAAEEAGTTRRYISISSLEVRDDMKKPMPHWYDTADKNFSASLASMFRSYFRARLVSDKSLVDENSRRKLEYTIVRPEWMSFGPSTGRTAAGRCRISGMVSREDVTTVLEHCINSSKTIGLAFDVAGGGVPIKAAVDNAV
ncbi:hypothetical protein GQ44DRAFT_808797, partial [Phaeosphaeriaceae sp. PMI808]